LGGLAVPEDGNGGFSIRGFLNTTRKEYPWRSNVRISCQTPPFAGRRDMAKAKKNSTTKKLAAKLKSVGKKKTAKTQTPPAETKQPIATASAAPKVGDVNLATEADFTSPAHPRLSDYRYYALVDNKNRIVGRGFLARVDKDPRRTWFALRNEEQTALWETSKWAIREIAFERFQELTLEYLTTEGWPEFKSTRAKEAAAA
jgi:hypothetical protein